MTEIIGKDIRICLLKLSRCLPLMLRPGMGHFTSEVSRVRPEAWFIEVEIGQVREFVIHRAS
ncbi:MAG: hypothetical protein MK110_15745 [Fuerstiella sp.]|nr:hypothetical protein [Fuerstiella sp.]